MEQSEWIDLVERARRGERPAQEALFRAARDRVYYHFGRNKTEQAALAYRHQQRAHKPEQK